MSLPVVPLDTPHERQHRTAIATSLNELVKFFNTIESGSWTPVVLGSGTAGTYEIDSNLSRYTRIGRRVYLDLYIGFAAVITGGGVGNLRISGLPFNKAANTFPLGPLQTDGVDWTASAQIALAFETTAASNRLFIRQAFDNAATTQLPISAVVATDAIVGSICYETDDP